MSSQLPGHRIEVASERGVLLTWRYTVGSIVFVVVSSYLVVVGAVFLPPRPLAGTSVALLVSVLLSLAATIRFGWLLKPGLGSGLPALRYTLMLLLPALLSIVFAVADGSHDPFFLLPAWWAACFLASLLPRRRLLATAVAAGLLTAIYFAAVAAAKVDLANSVYFQTAGFYFWFLVVMVPSVLIGGLWWWDIVVQLNSSRKAYGDLSVARERLRFAADLHDIQGHHLQVIALKTELAERVIDTDPATAKQQIHEAQVLARTALQDTRALVRGYRRVAFTTELKNAGEVLEAASIRASVQAEEAELSSEQGSLFGSVIREGTTNILRHSSAEEVSIRFWTEAGKLVLTVRNDGVAEPEAGTPSLLLGNDSGTGLAALQERLAAAGGSFDYGPDDGGFLLTATIPEES